MQRPYEVRYFKVHKGQPDKIGHCASPRNAMIACVRNIFDNGMRYAEVWLPGGVHIATVQTDGPSIYMMVHAKTGKGQLRRGA